MANAQQDDLHEYVVVKNGEDQFSICFADKKVPVGWESVGKTGAKAACLEYIKATWTDMTPRSVRNFRERAQEYLFGELDGAYAERIATIQTIGGSGAIRVGAELLKRYYPDSQVWVSDPTWDNHHAIFKSVGFDVQRYRYLKESGQEIDFQGMIDTFDSLPANTVVLLHACGHNPTGLDLTPAQWNVLFSVCAYRKLIPFLDAAYLGMGDGLIEDCYAIRILAYVGITGIVSNSFSKVFSLYGERMGSLSIVCENFAIAECVYSQLKGMIRNDYSNSH